MAPAPCFLGRGALSLLRVHPRLFRLRLRTGLSSNSQQSEGNHAGSEHRQAVGAPSSDTSGVESSPRSGPWETVEADGFRLAVLVGTGTIPVADDNFDVEVALADGTRWGATVFTLENLDRLMRQGELSGDCSGGLYVWADRMIVMRTITLEALVKVTQDLLQTGEFASAFRRLQY